MEFFRRKREVVDTQLAFREHIDEWLAQSQQAARGVAVSVPVVGLGMHQQVAVYKSRSFIRISILCVLASLVTASGGACVSAAEQAGGPSLLAAALRFQQRGSYDLYGKVVRCKPGEKVGILVEGPFALTIANAVIEDCEVGVVVTGGVMQNTSGDVSREPTQEWAMRVAGVTVRATAIGMWLAGNGGTVANNIVRGALYGIVVTGDDYTLTNNQSSNNVKDGFLVTGDRNFLEGNEAKRNGRYGIHVASMVPMIKGGRILPFIQDRALGNVIRRNTAVNNTRDLVEFATDCAGNSWRHNIFETHRPRCIK